ncbi:uncharacterized protein LOC120109628 [Phoenix dactylifera]|uniref:Uncharacterized protein LOC120109628 n=1 Tax=Phoenix dactylifera TaxID=42345 RepID=A0A8B8ZYE2_PHODC|nr:uncharacterized protein LOC120109628 [Phoenix dactylifera]
MGHSTYPRDLGEEGVPIPADCEGCLGEEETTSHVLFTCPWARQVWGLVATRRQSFISTEAFLSQVRDSARRFDMADRGVVWAHVAYHIWLDRNARIFEGRGFYPRLVVTRAYAHAAELVSAAVDSSSGDDRDTWGAFSSPHRYAMIPLVSWAPPPPGSLKVNFDGSVAEGGSRCGVGFVIRDHDSRLIVAGGRRTFDGSVYVTELHATWEGLLYMLEYTWVPDGFF